MSESVLVNKVTDPAELEKVFAIRRKVFVEEQQCPPELEWEHEDESNHFLAIYNNIPAGAARWRRTDNGYKLERFAVLAELRGNHIGQELVQAILKDLPPNASPVYLHAQTHAMEFYRKLGFKQTGPLFTEAGIEHYKMILS